jgi:hypothetical protein
VVPEKMEIIRQINIASKNKLYGFDFSFISSQTTKVLKTFVAFGGEGMFDGNIGLINQIA